MCESKPFSGYAADIWAAGVCLYVFVTGRLPFYADSPTDLFDLIAFTPVPIPPGTSPQLVSLFAKILAKVPSDRISIGDTLNHDFCQEAKGNRLACPSIGESLQSGSTKKIVVSENEKANAFKGLDSVNFAVAISTGVTSQVR